MHRGIAEWQATRSGFSIPLFLAFIAEAELARGDVTTALRMIDDALGRIAADGERLYEAELHRLRGETLLARGEADTTGAEASFLRAIDVARDQRARSFELRAAVSLVRLWQRGGRAGDGRRLLADVVAMFTEGFETRDLCEANRLLEAT